MTAIGDHCDLVRGWLNFEYSDGQITSFTRMAEEYLNSHLRCKHMVQIDRAVITEGRVTLPTDWLELDYVRVDGGKPLRYRSRDEFFNRTAKDNEGFYSITGNFLMMGGQLSSANNLPVEISYYQNIPPLGDDPNWLMKYYSRLYLAATLSVAFAYSVEDERAALWQASVAELVEVINTADRVSGTSGSPVVKRSRKGFG